MANTPISDFPAASSANASDVLAGVQDGVTKKFSLTIILNWLEQQITNLFVPTSREINGKDLSTDITLDASDVGAVDADDVGVADGVASLDSNGKVPPSQLPPISSDAEDITYDPTTSGLSATNVQDAIDEVVTDLDGKQDEITANGILKGDGQGGVSAATPGTDYQAPLTAGTDYATPAQLADKANQSQLAYVETGATASRAYAVGEYFCWNGLLYRVTTAISSGGTITPGTNCTPTPGGGLNAVTTIYNEIVSGTTSASGNIATPYRSASITVLYAQAAGYECNSWVNSAGDIVVRFRSLSGEIVTNTAVSARIFWIRR